MLTVFSVSTYPASLSEIQYSGLGNFKAICGLPSGKPPFPCVIYAYDQFVDWNGIKFATHEGYDLYAQAYAFSNSGYVCIVPVERFRKMDSLKSAVYFAQTQAYIDPKRIYMVGMSEGGFMVLMAIKSLPEVKRAVVINPRSPNDTGYFSTGTLLDGSNSIRAGVLFYMSRSDIYRARSDSLQLFHGLRTQGCRVQYLEKNVGYKWFWQPSQEYVSDVLSFLGGNR